MGELEIAIESESLLFKQPT